MLVLAYTSIFYFNALLLREIKKDNDIINDTLSIQKLALKVAQLTQIIQNLTALVNASGQRNKHE